MHRSTRRVSGIYSIVVFGTLSWPGEAWAHRLQAECHILADNHVQVECWFENSGQVPQGADVRVYRADGTLFAQGTVDAKGLFVFSYGRAERLHVIVFDGQGHAAKVLLSERDLASSGPSVGTKNGQGAGGPPLPRSVRSTSLPMTELLAGVGLLLAAAALILSWRNARRLRALERQVHVISPTAKSPPAAPPTDPSPH